MVNKDNLVKSLFSLFHLSYFLNSCKMIKCDGYFVRSVPVLEDHANKSYCCGDEIVGMNEFTYNALLSGVHTIMFAFAMFLSLHLIYIYVLAYQFI